jgi:hypothetical protein
MADIWPNAVSFNVFVFECEWVGVRVRVRGCMRICKCVLCVRVS